MASRPVKKDAPRKFEINRISAVRGLQPLLCRRALVACVSRASFELDFVFCRGPIRSGFRSALVFDLHITSHAKGKANVIKHAQFY